MSSIHEMARPQAEGASSDPQALMAQFMETMVVVADLTLKITQFEEDTMRMETVPTVRASSGECFEFCGGLKEERRLRRLT